MLVSWGVFLRVVVAKGTVMLSAHLEYAGLGAVDLRMIEIFNDVIAKLVLIVI